MIRDKDLELESLRDKNTTLVQIVEENEKERKAAAAVAVEADAKQSSSSSGGHLAKATVDNSNEIVVLKDKIRELESKLLARDDQLVSNDASLSDNKLEVLLNFA